MLDHSETVLGPFEISTNLVLNPLTLARAAIILDCILRVEPVLARCCCMCPLSVAVEHDRWFLINDLVRQGMVASSSLRSSALRSVDAGREHMIWWM